MHASDISEVKVSIKKCIKNYIYMNLRLLLLIIYKPLLSVQSFQSLNDLITIVLYIFKQLRIKGVPESEPDTEVGFFFLANVGGLTNYIIRHHFLIRKL